MTGEECTQDIQKKGRVKASEDALSISNERTQVCVLRWATSRRKRKVFGCVALEDGFLGLLSVLC